MEVKIKQFLEKSDFKYYSINFGIYFTDDEINFIYNIFDFNKSNKINYEEFIEKYLTTEGGYLKGYGIEYNEEQKYDPAKGYIEADKSAQFFSQSSKQTSGYCILCACSDSETAKETSELSNGRFTHFLLEMIKDLRNYNKYGVLDVNVLFSKVDLFFKVSRSKSGNRFVI